MPTYHAARYGDPRRYLLKALREIAHRIEDLVAGLDEHALRARVPELGEEWCVVEIVGYLRDSEREDLEALEALLRRDGAPLPERRAYLRPFEHDYRNERVEDLVWDFLTLREETVWTLRTAGPGWEHCGRHPYRGEVSVEQWVQEMNERDLDAMWRIQRLRDALVPARRRGPA